MRTPPTLAMMIPVEVLGQLEGEIVRQDGVSTYGSDRDGVRLAIACMEDELAEVLDAFQREKRPIDGRTWEQVQGELRQLIAVGLRLSRDLYMRPGES